MIEQKEKEKIKTLIESVKALICEGYKLSHGDHYKDLTAISDHGKQFKVRTIYFSLYKQIPLESEEEEINLLIIQQFVLLKKRHSFFN